MSETPQSFAEFWLVYVRAHRHPATRALHLVGTLAGWSLLAAAVATRTWWLVLIALAVGYGFAWIGHFFVEHNKPATFGHPGWSWLADQKMVAMMLLGRMGEEVRRAASSSGAEV
ncbi:MAG: Mpo1-like protein [Candidatus Acidiferrales bacterium]